MEQIVPEIVGRIVNTVTGYITKQVRYVTSKTYVTNMRNKMKELNGRSDDVTDHVKTNKMYDRKMPARVEGWLRDVENIRTEVESIPSDLIGCSHMATRYRAGRNASKASVRIQELIDEKIEWTDAPLPKGRPTSPSRSTTSSSSPSVEVGFKSRDIPFNEALKFLQQDGGKSRVIALCGMGGAGKTTMMKQLKTVADEKKMFGWFVEVSIGKEPNMHSIQNKIAECFGGEGLQNESKRAEGLRNMFKKKLEDENKKILVILDDVWSPIPLGDIGLTCPLPHGVIVLLTSRDAGICKTIAGNVGKGVGIQVVNVNVLEEAEANNFFSEITEVSEKDDHDKYLIGCEIVNKCGGLPLAIRIIGSTLKFQEVHVWRDQLNRLKHNDLDKNVQEIILISYKKLEDKDKDILLLCGLFPEDFDIPIEYLMRYAWGLYLLQHVSTLTESRDKTRASFDKLIDSSLLMKSDYLGCVKMHDLVLDFVLHTVSNRDPAWIVNHSDVSKWDRDEINESCKRISLTCMGMSKFPRNFSSLDLSLLQLMDGDQLLKFSEDFYDNMQNLKVMAYYSMEYPLLPRSLKCSTNLRTLCLHECKLKVDLSFLGDLVNLEELSFAGCGILKLPSTIGNLRKLKLQDLTGCVNLIIDDGVFGNLKNLEELYMRVAHKEGIRFTDAKLEEFKRLLVQLYALEVEFAKNKSQLKNVSFKKLVNFKISIGCLFEEEEKKEKYSFRNTLKLV